MPNPFPGMDPYLEGDLWTSVHTDLCAEIARQLSPKLRPKYRVLSTEPIPHISLEIHDAAQRRLVTCIELLSPTNKRGSGREEYAAKRLQILSGPANLMEIDLLRAGSRYPTVKPLPSTPYFVFVSRTGNRNKVELHPIVLERPLPETPVPLLEGDPDVMLDLQQALSTVYNIFAYDELLDYSQPPPGPLTAEQATWIHERLKSASRRQ